MSADNVARAMEETVTVMRSVQRARLLNPDELADVTRRRRDFEYRLLARGAPRSAFLSYATYERDLAELLKQRAEKRGIKKSRAKLIVHQTATRANLVYSRAVRRFKGDVQLWLRYARHLVECGSHRRADDVLGRALALRPDAPDVWLAAIALHADTMGDAGGARKLSLRALRSVPDGQCKPIWATYFRVELAFLCKALARRVSMRLPSPANVDVVTEGKETQSPADEQPGAMDLGHGQPNESATNKQAEGEDDIGGEGADESMDDSDDDAKFEDADEEKPDDVEDQTTDGKQATHAVLPKGPEKRARALKFWQGGIPLAVFNEAKERAKLSFSEMLDDYWKVAVDMPHSPAHLIRHIHSQLVVGDKDQFVYQLISARLPFDVAIAHLSNMPQTEGDTTGEEENGAEGIDGNTEYGRAKEAVKKATRDVYAALVPLLQASRVKDVAAAKLVAGFCERAKDYLSGEEKQEILEELANMKKKQHEDDEASENVPLGRVLEEGTAEVWKQYLTKNKEAKGAWKTRIRNMMMEVIAVPFRSAESDRIAVLWLEWEDDWEKLVEGLEKLRKLPPVSARLLRAAVDKLKRYVAADDKRDESVAMLGQLYEQITSLSKLRGDVDLWIEYIEFLRDTCMDGAKCDALIWKVRKSLPHTTVELLEEKLSIRALAR